jgi:hypothetical protein
MKKKKRSKQKRQVQTNNKTSKFKSFFSSISKSVRQTTFNIGNRTKELVTNVKAGEKLAKDCEQVANVLKETADKHDLIEVAKQLRMQASVIEAVARNK